jgi:ribonuclease HII
MPNSAYYHKELLPENLSLIQAEQVLAKHFENHVLIGVDEAGRGPIAGPVVAAAVVVVGADLRVCPAPTTITALNDSKKLSEKQREKIFEELPNYCKHYSIAEASAQEIDELGILNANFLAMRRTLAPIISSLEEKKQLYKILVDGNLYIREIDESLQMPIIKGDGRVACIAAASIFAKVHRDRLMVKFSEQFPNYGFEKHKGYGTKAHLEAVKKLGLCEIHRKSFNFIS